MINIKVCILLPSLLVMVLLACNDAKPAKATVVKSTHQDGKPTMNIQKAKNETIKNEPVDSISEFATYYVVIADTSLNYNMLREKMFTLSTQLKQDIDTMGRFFDAKKNLISLPKDDVDELYAGEYFPRRSPGESLSLEYLEVYKPTKNNKQIALVTGIYETEDEADNALSKLEKSYSTSFKVKSSIYVGCMH